MKKILLMAIMFCFAAGAWAQADMDDSVIFQAAPMNCEQFLQNPLVMSQLKQVFGDTTDFTVRMDAQKKSCDLKIVNDEKTLTFEFSSRIASQDSDGSTKTFVYDGKTLRLYLYEKDFPKCENVLEGDFENGVLLDVSYDFPMVDGKCNANAK